MISARPRKPAQTTSMAINSAHLGPDPGLINGPDPVNLADGGKFVNDGGSVDGSNFVNDGGSVDGNRQPVIEASLGNFLGGGESSLVQFSRREAAGAKDDESELVHISRREDDEPKLVHISRREDDESKLVHISRREDDEPELVHIS
ncbi:hypothetical protein BBAD15_g6221 [Beauveria bassiana D1-5]|uniref:Uncharacterized protein n=1 Tax=Beauveria bassiana D1-5 TaxID=1245745 RepID=A0A0A2VKM5_BEABA|nr:hypothetical protein BBAD15_g6221 [Beauveria bassiana D1-5]